MESHNLPALQEIKFIVNNFYEQKIPLRISYNYTYENDGIRYRVFKRDEKYDKMRSGINKISVHLYDKIVKFNTVTIILSAGDFNFTFVTTSQLLLNEANTINIKKHINGCPIVSLNGNHNFDIYDRDRCIIL